MNTLEGYSIAIPAYGRPREFEELLMSILDSSIFPDEVIVCEDFSPERSDITQIALRLTPLLDSKGIKFSYIENDRNLGYDGNVRKLIESAAYKWVILIGNDDLFLPDGLQIIDEYCKRNPNVAMISRPFLRFYTDINNPIGISRLLEGEHIITKDNYSAKYIFRVCGFVGGLIINKNWAEPFHTNKYDGSLYYQIYLGAHAYCTNGIGYLSKPTIGGRAGNPPLFGESGAEHHVPGAYSAKGRASMWRGVLDIANDLGNLYRIDLKTDLKRELTVRQSFHIFEMNAGTTRANLNELKQELVKLDLFNHWFPRTLFFLNYVLGKGSKVFYLLSRKIMQ